MRLGEAFLFLINREIYSNSSTIIKPFKDEALIVPNFRQMLFLVSCSIGRRKIEPVALQCLPLTFLPARNTWCLETKLWVSARINPLTVWKKCHLPVWKQLRSRPWTSERIFILGELGMNTGHSQQRKLDHRNTPKSGSGRICWPAGEVASASSISYIGSINTKLAYWQTASQCLHAMLIKKNQSPRVINNLRESGIILWLQYR